MTSRLTDPRSQVDVTQDLASLIARLGCWWRRVGATTMMPTRCATIRRAARATSSAAGLTPLNGPGLASQPTLSRFTALLAGPANPSVLREAVLEPAGRGIRAERGGQANGVRHPRSRLRVSRDVGIDFTGSWAVIRVKLGTDFAGWRAGLVGKLRIVAPSGMKEWLNADRTIEHAPDTRCFAIEVWAEPERTVYCGLARSEQRERRKLYPTGASCRINLVLAAWSG